MDKHQIFSKNLMALQSFRQQSLGEFSEEIGIPKSTLQSVLAHGNTTLDTAIRISDGLNLPLDTLISDELACTKLDVAQYLLQSLDWFCTLSPEEQNAVTFHIRAVLEVIHK